MLISVISVLLYEFIINKEFEKASWDFSIYASSTKDIAKQDNNKIKIISYSIGNSLTGYSSYSLGGTRIDHSTIFLMNSKDYLHNSICCDDPRMLYPNYLSLYYYAIDEKKAYKFDGKILYDKIKQTGSNFIINRNYIIMLYISPKGKIEIKMARDDKRDNPTLIETLQATEEKIIMADLKNDASTLENISNKDDYTALLSKKYFWKFSFKAAELEDVSITSFSEKNIDFSLETERFNIIPETIRLRWTDENCLYISNYYFDGKEILDAFEKLSPTKENNNIELRGEINRKKNMIEFYLTNNSESIFLKNIFSEKLECHRKIE